MSGEIAARRNTLLVATATGVVAGLGLTGDIIFDVFEGRTAWAVCGGAAVAAAALGAYGTLKAHRTAEPAPTNAAAASRALPPRELPPREALAGDTTALEGLRVHLSDVPTLGNRTAASTAGESQAKLVVVHGQPGVGKTALALNAAHQVKDAYPDGQIYLDLRGDRATPLSSRDALGHMLRSLHVAREDMPDTGESRSALFRTLTAGQRLLLLLDNAHSTDQVEPLLPTGTGCSVLITSRRALSLNNVTQRDPVPVHLPDDQNALAVLAHYAGQERVAAELAAAMDIVRFCGNLPLALRLVGCKVRQRSGTGLARMRDLLQNERERLDHLRYGNRSLAACLTFSFQSLTPAARTSLALLAALPPGRLTDWHFTRFAATRGAGISACDELVEVAMMEALDDGSEETEGAYRMHDLIRVFAARRFEELPPEERNELEERLVGAYRDAVVHWAAYRAPELRAEVDPAKAAELGDEPSAAAEWVASEQERLQWAIDRARNLGLDTVAAEIGEALSYFLDDITLPPNSADWLFTVPGDSRSRVQAGLRRARARAALAEGDPDRALTLLSSEGDDTTEAVANRSVRARDAMVVARVYSVKGDYRTALDRMAAAVAPLRDTGDSWHTLESLELLGELQRWTGTPELAEQSQREALRIAEEAGDLRVKARLRRTLAETLGYLRRPEEAAPLLEASRDDFRLLGDRLWEAKAEYALGKIHRLLGEREKALECYSRAEGIFGPMGERPWLGRVHNARIRVLAGMGRLEDAEAAVRAALALFEQVGATMWVAHTQRDVGWLRLRAGRPEEAVAPLTYAVDACEAAGDAYAGSMAHHLRGVAHRELGRYEQAHADFDAALEVYRSGAYEWNAAAVAHDVIRALRAEGRDEEAGAMEREVSATNPVFVRMHGRDGAVAVPDED
ncbi:tetratricopeptide repeat protein [Streptomyces sp. RO-S4]|uniref:tetratricopeptide repeat protein n=1 Tax=Streptomyces sp. RO-S4 TaxID=2902486 RepID=UPI00208FDFD5|nr:tetratricopeptide repeat protein [Streptomyces sp. RO-S4]MCO4695795.1 tetratricopeptide repeat protein [Streptomyces sp. RO-S4]